ncbi:MAG: endonuclease NucS domain-containing protein, partial [bacterium]
MPLELGVWRIDNGDTQPVEFAAMDFENRLEDILHKNIDIASPNWLIIGRQVPTDYGGIIDLLAMDRDANLIVIELKRDKTPRDIVAQLLDYGSWVAHLEVEHITQIFDEYQRKWQKGKIVSIDEAFKEAFGATIPEEMNASHELV